MFSGWCPSWFQSEPVSDTIQFLGESLYAKVVDMSNIFFTLFCRPEWFYLPWLYRFSDTKFSLRRRMKYNERISHKQNSKQTLSFHTIFLPQISKLQSSTLRYCSWYWSKLENHVFPSSCLLFIVSMLININVWIDSVRWK